MNENPNRESNEIKVLITGDKPRNFLPQDSQSNNLAYSKTMFAALETIAERAINQIIETNPGKKIVLLTGLELGVEQAAARRALEMGVAVKAFVPFKEHGKNWTPESQKQYQELVARIAEKGEIVRVSEKDYSPERLQIRDYRMVDEANLLVSLHNPNVQPAHQKTLDYAAKRAKTKINAWHDAEKHLNDVVKNHDAKSSSRQNSFEAKPISNEKVDLPEKSQGASKAENNEHAVNNAKTVVVNGDAHNTEEQIRLLDLNKIAAPELQLLAPSQTEIEAVRTDKTQALSAYADRLRADYKENKNGLRDALKELGESLGKNEQIAVSCGCRNGEMCHADVVKMAIEKVGEYVKSGQIQKLQEKSANEKQIVDTQENSKNNQSKNSIRINLRTERAISEILAASETDRILEKINQTDGRNQSEQASYLNQKSQFVREVYERGGNIVDGNLIVPVEKLTAAPALAVTTQEYAVNKANEILKDEAKAKEVAPTIIEYGNKIAGQTADAETRLKVFAWMYDALAGKSELFEQQENLSKDANAQTLAADNFAQRLDEISRLAEEMHRLEPADKIEFVPLDSREQQPDFKTNVEDESRLSEIIYEDAISRESIEENQPLDLLTESETLGERADEHQPGLHDESSGKISTAGFERIDLARNAPTLPVEATEYEIERLFSETLPDLDRNLENGMSAREILKPFNQNVGQSIKDNVLNKLEAIYQKQKLHEIESKLSGASPAAKQKLKNEKAAWQNATPTPKQEDLKQLLSIPAEIKYFEAKLATLQTNQVLEQARDEKKVERNALNERLTTLKSQVVDAAHLKEIAETVAQEARIKVEVAGLNERIAERFGIESRLEDLRFLQTDYQSSKNQKTIAELSAKNQPTNQNVKTQLENINIYGQNVVELKTPGEYKAAEAIAEKNFYQKTRQEIWNIQQKLEAVGLNKEIGNQAEKTLRNELNRVKELKPLFAFKLENSNEIVVGAASSKTVEERNFVAGYINHQLKKPETRLRHENERYRVYAARLENAATRAEVIAAASEIRAENAALGLKWNALDKQEKAQQARPLSAKEMQFLFTEASPASYTPEMTVAKLAYAHAGESRRLMTAALVKGEIKPSLEAQKLVDSLAARLERRELKDAILATKHFFESIKTANENLRYKNNFDHRETYRRLSPPEKDFVYHKTQQQKENLEYRLAYKQQQFIRSGDIARENGERENPALSPAEKSFYLLSQFNQARILGEQIHSAAPPTKEIAERDLHAVGIILQNQSPARIENISRELAASGNLENKKFGEILATFGKAETATKDGKTMVEIRLLENAAVSPNAYQKLLEKFYPDDERENEKYKLSSFSEKTVEAARIKGQDETLNNQREELKNNVYKLDAPTSVFAAEREVSENLSNISRLQQSARDARQENQNLLEKYAHKAEAKLKSQKTIVPASSEQKQLVEAAFKINGAANFVSNKTHNAFFQAVQKEVTVSDFQRFATNEKLIAQNTAQIKQHFGEIAFKQSLLEENKLKIVSVQQTDKIQDAYYKTQAITENRLLTEVARIAAEKGEIENATVKTIGDSISETEKVRIKTASFDQARIRLEPIYKEFEAKEYNEQALKLADEIEKAHQLSKQNAPASEVAKAFENAEREKDALTRNAENPKPIENLPLSLRLYEAEVGRIEKQLLSKSIGEKLSTNTALAENDKTLDLTKIYLPEELEQIKLQARQMAKERLEPKELDADHRKISPQASKQALATFKQLEQAYNVYQFSNDQLKIQQSFRTLDCEAATLNKLRQDYNRSEKIALLRDGVKTDLADLLRKNSFAKDIDLTLQTSQILTQNLLKTGLDGLVNDKESVQIISRKINENIENKHKSAMVENFKLDKVESQDNSHRNRIYENGVKVLEPTNQKIKEISVRTR